MRTLASPWSMFAALVMFAVSVPLCTGPSAGCANGGAINQPGTPANAAANLGLDLVAVGLMLDSDDPQTVAAGRAELQRVIGDMIALASGNHELGQTIAAVAAEWERTGKFDEGEWAQLILALKKWINTPPPTP